MRLKLPVLLLIYCLLLPLSFILHPFNVFPEDPKMPVVIDGDQVSYSQEQGKIIARGNVVIKSLADKTELFCQETVYDTKLNTASLMGDVKVIKDEMIIYGKDIVYDFNTGNAEMTEVRFEDFPLFGESDKGKRVGDEGKLVLEKNYITTCDLSNPHYRMVTKSATIYPGERVVAKNVVLKIGNFPIFYLPRLSLSLKDQSPPGEFTPGKDNDWGLFFLTRWRYRLNDENRGKIMLDYYQKRGLGTGFTHNVETKNFGTALIKYYQINDTLYHLENRVDLLDKYSKRMDVDSKYLEDDRYKAQLSYSWNPQPNLSIKSEFHKFSDQYFMKDFFEREYDIDPHPLSYILMNYSLENASLSLLAQKRMNHFWAETEYLPQLEYDFFRQAIGDSNFYIESNEKIGNINYKFADGSSDSSANSGKTQNAFRIISHNTLSYANKIKWLGIEPYLGYYANFYSHDKDRKNNVWRLVPEAGITFNTKLYKMFDSNWNIFGEEIKQIRHIMTPELKYEYIHAPKLSDAYFYNFDGDDVLTRTETVTFTLRNKIQARNEERTWDFIYFSPSVTYQAHQEGERPNYFDKLTIDFEVYPRSGISLHTKTEYDLQMKKYTSFEADLSFSKKYKVTEGGEEVEKERYVVSLGHRYQRKDNTEGTLNFEYQLTPKLRFKSYIRFIYNTEDFQEQQYAIRADLHCWWLDVGIDLNRRTEGSKDTMLWFAFTLKAYPDINIGFDQTYDGGKKSYYD